MEAIVFGSRGLIGASLIRCLPPSTPSFTGLLTPICEALTSLLFPFRWQVCVCARMCVCVYVRAGVCVRFVPVCRIAVSLFCLEAESLSIPTPSAQHIYIPMCPSNLLDFLQAPVPFIIGIRFVCVLLAIALLF